MFRKLEKKGNIYEFTGGIFHAFKHFSYNDKNLSTGKDINNINTPEQIIEMAIKAFFFEQREALSNREFVSKVELNDKYNLKFVFYYEEQTEVFFIKTIFKELNNPRPTAKP